MSAKHERHAAPKQQKIVGQASPIFGAFKFLEVPETIMQRMLQTSPDKSDLMDMVHSLVAAKELGNHSLIAHSARAIGRYVTDHLQRGNYDAPRVVSQTLQEALSARGVKNLSGISQGLRDRMLVVIAYYSIEKTGCKNPSQVDVRTALDMMGHPLRKDRVSKLFDTLGLRDLARDGRLAVNRAKPQVADK